MLPEEEKFFDDDDVPNRKEHNSLSNEEFNDKVLIIDDEPMNITVLKSLLENEKVESESMASGVKALEHLGDLIFTRQPLYKVILIDFCMPGLDGPQTALHIRELCQDAGRQVPYMACCSAYTESTFEQIALGAGISVFYTKPLSTSQIKELVAQLN